MGILKPISDDVDQLVQAGFDDYYICKSVGVDFLVLEYIIQHFRKQYNKQPTINIRDIYRSGD